MINQKTRDAGYRLRRLRRYLEDLWGRREFAWYLALGNFKARNASTALGLFWWVLNPLLLSLVYWFVFGLIFPGARDIIYLVAGMFVFHFTAQALTGGANSILQNSKLLANLKFPRLILPLASILESLVGFLVSLGVLLVLQVLLNGFVPGVSILILMVAIPLHMIFNLGLASIAGRMAVPFRDINNFIPYLTRVWLYLSPIIWPLSFLESPAAQSFARFADDNPLFAIISVYRAALIGDPFDPAMLMQFAIWSGVVGVVGVGAFVWYEGKIVRHL